VAQELHEPLPWTAGVFQYALQGLYEFDVAEEAAILEWAAEAAKAPAGSRTSARHAQCATFLNWLREAEEDDEGEEDEEEDGDEDE
jgi:ribosomal protein L12E/L44/L45/RPP1/RPP2